MKKESMVGLEGVIRRQEFQRLSLEWTALDDEYDTKFQNFLNNPDIKSPREVAEFQAMSKKLYALEAKLFKIAEGKISIVD